MFCEKCGSKINDGDVFCANCGAVQSTTAKVENVSAPNNIPDSVFNSQPVQKKSFFSKKKILIGGVALLLVVLVAVGAFTIPSLFNGGSNTFDGVLYLKDGAGKIAYANSDETYKVPKMEYSECVSIISQDSKYLFYPDGEGDLYRIKISGRNLENEEAEKIGSKVSYFEINDNGTKAAFMTRDNKFYISNIDDKDKIDSDVTKFYVNDDFSRIIYTTSSNKAIYYKEGGKDSEKIDEDAEILFHSEDLTDLYYTADSNIYRVQNGKEPKKIVSDIPCDSSSDSYESSVSMFNLTDDGKFYYTCASDSKIYAGDFIEDDMAESDENIEEPDYDDKKYIKKSGYFTTHTDEYYDLLDEYEEKEARDEIRTEMATEEVSVSVRSLYYYDGKKSTLLSDSLDTAEASDSFYYSEYQQSSKLICSDYDFSAVEKIKMSEINSSLDYSSEIAERIQQKLEYCCYSGENKSVFASDTVLDSMTTSKDLSTLYYLERSSSYSDLFGYDSLSSADNSSGTLYKIDISKNKPGKAEKIADDVYSYSISEDDEISYLKDYSSNGSTLYFGNDKVDDDVYKYSVVDGNIFYFTDYNDSNGTLKKYANGKSEKISDDVDSFNSVDGDKVFFLYDYDDSKGDLKYFNGSESKKIDSDVSSFAYFYQKSDE